MTRYDPRLAEALLTTADRLAGGARYEWGHVGRCNCGHLVQTLTERNDAEIFRLFGQELTEWTEHARGSCSATNQDIEEMFATLQAFGLGRREVQHLEYLDDPQVLARLPQAERHELRRNRREDVVTYLRAFADLVGDSAAPCESVTLVTAGS